MCLASEKLSLSLYAFLTQNRYHGFFIADIQKIAYETLKALCFLRKLKLTHTDLKVIRRPSSHICCVTWDTLFVCSALSFSPRTFFL